MATLQRAAAASSKILEGSLLAAIQGTAREPLTFTILDVADCLTTGWAAVTCRVARRGHGRFMAAWPVAERRSPKNFCCVTTRELNLSVLNDLRLRLHSLAAFFLGLGVLGSDVIIQATFDLPAGRLPAPHLSQAFGILAITLVPASRLILAPTPFAQTRSQTEPAYSGRTVISCRTVAGAHGRCFLPGEARGECVTILLGRYKTRIRR